MGVTSLDQKSSPDFWKKVRVGDMVTLQGTQVIEDSMEENQSMCMTDRKVEKIQTVQEGDGLATWILFDISNQDELDTRLVAKLVGEDVTLSLVTEVDEFYPDTKQNLLKEECDWMFEQPEEEDFGLNDIDFSQIIIQEDVDSGDTFEFTQKSQGTLYGESKYDPEEEYNGIFTSITEYSCDDKNNDISELIIIEEGEDEEEGGFITILAGNQLEPSEVEIFGK